MAVDTACSSSLVAANAAREAVRSFGGGAVAGGINMMLMPGTTYMFKKAGMLSADGRCKALDASADGYVRSEACAVMVLSSQQVLEGEGRGGACVALVGTAVNQDGRSSSLTAPHGPSQQEVVRAALGIAGV